MVLHLNLTGWISSERNWHQDDYLNSAEINGWYLAVWMALDDVSPNSGPFQFILAIPAREQTHAKCPRPARGQEVPNAVTHYDGIGDRHAEPLGRCKE